MVARIRAANLCLELGLDLSKIFTHRFSPLMDDIIHSLFLIPGLISLNGGRATRNEMDLRFRSHH